MAAKLNQAGFQLSIQGCPLFWGGSRAKPQTVKKGHSELLSEKIGSQLAAAGKAEFLLASLTVIRNQEHRDAALTGAAEELAGKGNFQLACECASKVRDESTAEMLLFGTYAKIASQLLKRGEPHEAVAAINLLSHRPDRDKLRSYAAQA